MSKEVTTVDGCLDICEEKSNNDLYSIYREIGRDNELWYRCRWCVSWPHKVCKSADNALWHTLCGQLYKSLII